MKTAVIFGASGFVGSFLLSELLDSLDYAQVTAVVRRDLGISHPKLKTVIGDFQSLPNLAADLAADEVFITLGTTRKATPDDAAYYQVDHDYPVLAARMAKAQGAKSAFVVTAVGADPHSRFSYVKTKGETERDIIALDFEHTHIFRPSMITGGRQEKRPLEKTIIALWNVIDPLFIGATDKYRGMTGQDIAKAMRIAASRPSPKLKIYHWREMNELLRG